MFPPATPESMGLPSAAILTLIDRLETEGHDPHSLIVLRDGRSLAEGWWAPYRRDRVHRLYSLSKSFTSVAVGLAVDEGRLSLDDPVLGFFPDEAPSEPGENLRAMRVRDLLTMACGQDADDLRELRESDDWPRVFLSRPVPHTPGTHFLYNSSATYMLAAILARVTGEGLLDYLRPRLLDPLGVGPARWETDPQGVACGGWGLYLTTDAIARFGQLLLQKGRWGDRQLVPEAWIEEATAKQVDNSANGNPDWRQGYGYQFWRSTHDGFRGDGAFGQFCVVLPEQRLVVAITSASDDMQGVLDAVWSLVEELRDEPLPDDPDAIEVLKNALATRRVFRPGGDFSLPAPEIAGLQVGLGEWIENPQGIEGIMPGPVAASGAWRSSDPQVFTARIVSLESTESMTVEGTRYSARGTWGAREGNLN